MRVPKMIPLVEFVLAKGESMKIGRGGHLLVVRPEREAEDDKPSMGGSWSALASAMGLQATEPSDDSGLHQVPVLA